MAVAGSPDDIQVLNRQRIELLAPNSQISRFVYHTASEMPLAQAAELVKRAREASFEAASLAVKNTVEDLNARGIKIDVCGVLSGSTIVPDDLAAILRSHPMIHSAEGALFQNAIVSACESLRLKIVSSREREVWVRAAAAWDIAEPRLRKNVEGLRKSLGAPWSADHKVSTAVALLALKSQAGAKREARKIRPADVR